MLGEEQEVETETSCQHTGVATGQRNLREGLYLVGAGGGGVALGLAVSLLALSFLLVF